MSPTRLHGREWRLLALLAGVAALQTWLVHDMRFLASGLFGGDHAYQLACIRAIAASLDPMASCSVSGALPGYLPLYGTLVAYFSRVAAIDPLQAMFVTAVVFRTLSTFVVYRVFGRLFGRPTGFVMACLWSALHPELIFKYTEFTTGIVLPLYFLALDRYVERPGPGRAAALGLALAVLGYSHAVAFVGGVMIAALAIVAGIFVRGGLRGAGREALQALGHLPIFVACGALTLGYWWKPIVVHHGHTSLHYTDWSQTALQTFTQRLDWAGHALGDEFSFDGPARGTLTLLMAAGVVCFVASRARRRFATAAIVASASFAWLFHFFATEPLLHVHFAPLYVEVMHWSVARLFLAAMAVTLFFARPGVARNAGVVETAALVLALGALWSESREIHDSPDMVVARSEQDPAIAALTAWTAKHLDPEAVALSTNELSFAWSAMTGRKTVVSRRSQNDAFLDLDVRNRDAALMLYGRDDSVRVALLKKYRVGYLFWASNWFASEYQTRPPSDTLSFDPFGWFANAEYDGEAERGGLRITHLYTWVDPALQGPDYPRYDMTLLTPNNYADSFHPWPASFDSLLGIAWAYPDSGPKELAVLRVKLGYARER